MECIYNNRYYEIVDVCWDESNRDWKKMALCLNLKKKDFGGDLEEKRGGCVV